MIVDGTRWWSTRQAVDQLGVDRKTINQWVRRSRLVGHTAPAGDRCRPCLDRVAGRRVFPHVDPPRIRGRLAAYNADQLLAAEAHTAGCGPNGSSERADFAQVTASGWR